jgi:hypothetical protein
VKEQARPEDTTSAENEEKKTKGRWDSEPFVAEEVKRPLGVPIVFVKLEASGVASSRE